MPHTVKRLDEEPIIVVTIDNPYDYDKEPPQMFQKIADTADDIDKQGYVVYDCSNFTVTFGDLVAGMSAQAEGTPGSISDPQFSTIIVGSDEMLKMATESFKQEQYGKLDVALVGSLDEALKKARSDT